MNQSAGTGTKERLVEAGKVVIFRKGFHRARISDITSEAGLAHGTFYLYFRSKEDFLLELLYSLRENILGLIRGGKELIKRGNINEGKELLFLKSFDTMVKEKELAKILFFEAICTDRKFQEFYTESKKLLFNDTKEALDLLGVEGSHVKTHMIIGTARHLIELLILTGEEVTAVWREVLRELGVYS